MREIGAVLLIAAAGTLGAGCHHEEPPAPTPPTVTVAQPTTGPVTGSLEFTGNTAASNSVTLVARVEGYLEGLHFKDGSRVKKGQLLFTIQQEQYTAQLEQAQAQVQAQKAAIWHAKTELARYTNLVKESSAPQTEVDRWQYELESATAALLGAQAQVDIAKLNLSYTLVRAPFDGRMGRHLVDPGNVVGQVGQPTSLAVIDETDPLYVYFTVDERDLLRIRQEATSFKLSREAVTDQRFPISFGLLDEEGYPHTGTLDFASLGVAPTTGTLQVRGIFPNPDPGLPPGLFVRVRIPLGQAHQALMIPGEALGFDQQGDYVLVVSSTNVVERRAVKTGTQLDGRYVIEQGLQASDWVVTEGLQRAIPGRTVTPDRSSGAKSGTSAQAGKPPAAPAPAAPAAAPPASTGAKP